MGGGRKANRLAREVRTSQHVPIGFRAQYDDVCFQPDPDPAFAGLPNKALSDARPQTHALCVSTVGLSEHGIDGRRLGLPAYGVFAMLFLLQYR